MSTIKNFTPHTINVVLEEGTSFEFPSVGVARVSSKEAPINTIGDIPVVKTLYGEVEGLPDPEKDTIFIVSYVVLNALRGVRDDIVAPNTSPAGAIRDEGGRIVGVRGFQTL